MLRELSIENLALFERAALTFGPGLNVISGETGAGKSLLVGALELLLGDRARSSIVRSGAKETRVEGLFALDARSAGAEAVAAWLKENLPLALEEWASLGADDDREVILTRTVSADGKTRAFVNQRPVTQRLLRELAAQLVEIHGQNEHQRLLDTAEQTRLLDAFGELEPKLHAYRERRASWLAIRAQIAERQSQSRERRDRLDLLRFQSSELADARLSVDEHASLLRERELLRHASELGAQLGAITNELARSDEPALDVVRRAVRVLDHWESRIPSLAVTAQQLRDALLNLEEAASGIGEFLDGIEYSPERLEVVEARLYQLELLERKYATDIAGLVAREREIAGELASFEGEPQSLEALVGREARALEELTASARALTTARRALRVRLKRDVEKSLAELGLERARFEVSVEPRAALDLHSPNAPAQSTDALSDTRRFALDGADQVEFWLTANPGETPAPLRNVASGGEAARIMLALRTVLAARQTIPTLVFDEIDAGVGGRLGPKVGEHLRALSKHHQVLCVTHLPAIAALAHHHFKVSKDVAAGRTRTKAAELFEQDRVEEIADMIAGGAAHATARAEARRLLGLA
jgi:DNA repair protein RecN (Recombination protein N)